MTGDAVNVASRLETAASAGEILIGDDTYRLVRNAVLVEPVEALELKGKAEPVPAWRVLAVVTGAPSVARRLDSPIVDRKRELAILSQAFENVTAERVCHLVTLLGPAGVGKSRLTLALFSAVEDRTNILTGRCLPYGEGITFWPVVEVVKRAVGITAALTPAERRDRLAAALAGDPEADVAAEHLAALVGAGKAPTNTEQTFWSVRKLLEALAREKPLTVAFEDVHWGEETFLDLIEHIADWSRDAPILIVCLARPEFLEDRPAWGGGKLNATSLLLGPLAEEDAGALLDNLLEAELPREVKQRIVDAAEGNPLYVEEMLAMLIDDGVLRREDGRWVAAGDLSSLTVPPTIQALIAARLDRLSERERAVLERAAVAGKVFSRGAVRALSPPGENVTEPLDSLVRKQLVRPHRTVFAGEDTFRFRHILIRDAAYHGMSKDTRAELHERFAAWLERAGREHLAEYEEILGYHLEQAHRFRTEVGPAERVQDLGRRAAAHFASAGRRAFARADMSAAASLFTRARVLLVDDDGAWLGFAPEFGSALSETGQLARADAVLSQAIEEAAGPEYGRIRALVELECSLLRLNTDPTGTTDEARETAERAIAVFEQAGDDQGLAKALDLVARVHWIRCRYAEMEEVLERSLEHARRAGDRREVSIILNALARATLVGPRPVEDGLRVCADIRDAAPDDRSLEGVIYTMVGGLNARLGHFDEARELCRRGEAIFRDLGLSVLLTGLHQYVGGIELLAGDAVAAEREFRAGFDEYERMGDHGRRSTIAGQVAMALHAQGRDDEAHRYTVVTEESASPDDLASQVFWRQVRAQVLARRNELDEARRLGREAVELAAQTDFLWMHGDALVALAEVLRAAGLPDDAVEAAEQALDLYEAKGDLVSAEKTRVLVADLKGATLDRRPSRR
jgi:tetratricopeptide (TPR) repeat protein